MTKDYYSEFPIPKDKLPQKLAELLEPVGLVPGTRVEVSALYSKDQHGCDHEHLHMLMAVVPRDMTSDIAVLNEASDGVVSFSVPVGDEQGCYREYQPNVSGLDYIVASRGDGSFFSYSLAEKVWMMLGLTPRCLGGETQRIIYDDLSLPEFNVAEGEVSNEYYFEPNRDVSWQMKNEYLRKYLWMRDAHAARVFFFEALLEDDTDLRALMEGQSHVVLEPELGWFKLDIREFNDGLLIQCWATVLAVTPDRCEEPTIDDIEWPGIEESVTQARADADTGSMIYLDDRFLERYEQNGFYSSTPYAAHGEFGCSPSYKGQWGFSGCRRIGRNLIQVALHDLYKAIPPREVLHAQKNALSPEEVAHFDLDQEHIVSKTQRFLTQILELGENLSRLAAVVGINESPTAIVKMDRANIEYRGWDADPVLSRLAQVAPLEMSQQAFLSRCKTLHEVWQRIPDGFLKRLVKAAGCPDNAVNALGSLKLLQGLLNILQSLNANQESLTAFMNMKEPVGWNDRNTLLTPLFLNYELRIADAHESHGEIVAILNRLEVDSATLNQGYGPAIDAVFDGVVSSFEVINSELGAILNR